MIKQITNYFNSQRFKRLKWKKIGRVFIEKRFSIVSPDCISLGDKFCAGDNLKLQAWTKYGSYCFAPHIEIGDEVSFMSNCQISCIDSITIGDGCLFGDNVFVTDNFHGKGDIHEINTLPLNRNLYSKGRVSIGNNVWIGRNACIMPGVIIGDGSIIGANAVVTHDIPANSVAVGVPARVVKHIK